MGSPLTDNSVRGKIPYFVRPPEPELPAKTATFDDGEEAAATAAANAKVFGEGRVAGVVQPLHQIVSRQKFIEDDQDASLVDDGAEWGGIADETEAEVVENDLEGDASGSGDASEDSAEAEAEAQVVAEGADDLAWEDLVGETSATLPASASPKGKKREASDLDDEDSENDDRRKKQVKEPRMKTNKKQAENFFTHANVKNKNRNRKIPSNPDARKRRK